MDPIPVLPENQTPLIARGSHVIATARFQVAKLWPSWNYYPLKPKCQDSRCDPPAIFHCLTPLLDTVSSRALLDDPYSTCFIRRANSSRNLVLTIIDLDSVCTDKRTFAGPSYCASERWRLKAVIVNFVPSKCTKDPETLLYPAGTNCRFLNLNCGTNSVTKCNFGEL